MSSGFETQCQHFGEDPFAHAHGAAPPLYQNSTFLYPDAATFEQRKQPHVTQAEYTRVGNPTTDMLQAKLAKLERGAWCRMFASGMGAISAAVQACVCSGDHVVCVDRCYWPTRQYLKHMRRYGVETTFVKGIDPANFAAAFRAETKLLYVESPTSGFGDCPPVAPLVAAAHERGAKVIFDNSWASPYFCNPLEHGCDLVVHSATKFIGGHSDLVAGAVIGRDESLERRVALELELVGACCDPFAAWLMLRGLRTLPLRMERHHASALAVAQMLVEHPAVDRVYHPGVSQHPHHDIARQHLRGYGSLFGFTPKAQSREACHRIIDRLQLFGIGVSWGGHESLVVGGNFFSENPDVWFVRLHVGLESLDDLLADVRQALAD